MNEDDVLKCCSSIGRWVCPKEDCKKILTRKQTFISHMENIHGIQIDIPKKNYKLYEYNNSEEIPRSTKCQRQKRKWTENMEVATLPSYDQVMDKDASNNISASENLLENDIPVCFVVQENDNTEIAESDMDISSDEDSELDHESNDVFDSEEESSEENDTAENIHSEMFSAEPTPNIPLYVLPPSESNFISPISYDEHVLAVSTFAKRHNISDTAFEHLLQLIDLHIPENNLLERGVIKMKEKCGFSDTHLQFHTFCTHCQNVFSNGIDSCQTPFCPGRRKNNRSQNYFITGSLQIQLENILIRKDVWKSIQEQSENDASNITDIVDGSEYKKLKAGFLNCRQNISFAFFTDGVALFKSSGVSFWPVYLLINEMPRNQRFLKKNMILWGVWQGTGKPNMTIFLKSLVKDLQNLYRDGVTVTINDQQICCRGILVVATMDLPARAAVLNMTQYNGEYSCIFCMDPGKVVKSGKGHCRCFTFKEEVAPLRTTEEVLESGRLAQHTNKRVKGFHGLSVFSYLPGFSLSNNTVIDYMHGILLGICKKLLLLWFSTTSYDKPYFIGHLIKEIDKHMKTIAPPYMINRLPRKLSNTMHHWKASEIRSWLLFYSLPCLLGKLPDLYLKHFSMLVEATYILLGEGITSEDLTRADLLFNVFVKSSQGLYGENVMGLNVHSLIHLVACVKKWGPLWAWSCFCFESFNGELKKSIHGTGNVCKQIFWSLQAEKYVENMTVKGCNQNTEEFLRKLTSGKYIDEKKCQKAYQCSALNVKDITVEPENFDEVKQILSQFLDFQTIFEFYKSSKIIRNGYIIYSKMCAKVKKRNSYCVKLKDNEQYFEIAYFLCHKDSLHVFAVGQKLVKIGGVLANRVPHITEVKYESGDVAVVRAEDIQDLVVNTTVQKRTFLSLMPNKIERN